MNFTPKSSLNSAEFSPLDQKIATDGNISKIMSIKENRKQISNVSDACKILKNL